MKRKKAFSLIELLVVMVIIAILAVIAIPQYNKYKANAFYSKMETNLKNARVWAEQIKADYDKYPQGTCDTSSYTGSGAIKCSYDSNNDTIIIDQNGDLKIDIPLKAIFERQTSCNGIKITIECPAGRCLGLEPSPGTNASIWINTCENPEVIHTNTSLF